MSSDMPTYAELQAEIDRLKSVMHTYLPLIEKAERWSSTWAFLTEGTGIVTAHNYRAALQQEKRQ